MAKKIKKYKVGIDSDVYAISLVDEPAIESDFIALSKEEEEKVEVMLEKNEKYMVYGAALIPDKDIYRNNGEQEFYINFTKESIEKMSQDFMKEYRQKSITVDHQEDANEICVVESWLVEDAYKDKANALGINVPEGTWMIGMKVNNIETWDRIKSGELKGFSVESLISLEEFSKQNDDNMNTNDMSFWTKLKEVLLETLQMSKNEEEPQETEVVETELEEQQPAEPVVETEPVTEPTPEPAPEPEPVEEPKVEDAEVIEEIKEEKPNPLEELVKNLTDEIKALKESNNKLQEQVKEMSKQPSAKPVNPVSKPSAGDTYAAWREQMAKML